MQKPYLKVDDDEAIEVLFRESRHVERLTDQDGSSLAEILRSMAKGEERHKCDREGIACQHEDERGKGEAESFGVDQSRVVCVETKTRESGDDGNQSRA